MPVFRLSEDLIFPPPEFSEHDGLLAVGGDLSEERLLLAYSMGIFPWYSEGSPILWWSPDPRLVLIPKELKISRSLRQIINKNTYRITIDSSFDEVIRNCSDVHKKKHGGTWITDEMADAYIRLHKSGFAHSVESWHEGDLVGGLYGVSLGGAFFGESMFSKEPNASKVAFVRLVQQLMEWGFKLIDCQVTTEHLMSFGAKEIPRSEFMKMLKQSLKMPTKKGKWI
ncbi:MAG: leucyl/phenylalanyl-tRNA--protein transferase [Nitrospiraceae bacterium]|nr:leucyl/phenylalanyl-tRNA--protein transferase [Nitrospirota bacterium]MDA8337777.1 leucyl/phenylalanyl-tRNA--protein transferase [Nitrospiraceae bacterium]